MSEDEGKLRVSKTHVKRTGITRETIIGLHETPGVGGLTIDRIIRFCVVDGRSLLRQPDKLLADDWRAMGLHSKQANAIVDNLRPEMMKRRAQIHVNKEMNVLTYLDDDYPELLTHISDPPWVLYCKGNIELFRTPAIAIVGTRIATMYGRKMAEELAAGCATRMTVVSGLARGIDTAAHMGALKQHCSTIAVMAGPLDVCYPPENKALYREIAAQGLLVTETPPDLPLAPGMFPLRNRIIAGLAYGVIVVEAADRSGALITADLAFNYGRDVFIVPGPLTSPKSAGALEYTRKGGVVILDETDIFLLYKSILPEPSEQNDVHPKASNFRKTKMNLSSDESTIYDLLLDQPRSIDELTTISGMTIGLLRSVLLSLLIKKRIIQQPGSIFSVL